MTDQATPNLPSRDFDSTAAFYERLGFGIVFRDAGWMILQRGDLMLEFFAHPGRPPFAIQAAQLLGRAIGAGLFAITPAGERGMCCKAIKLGNARVFPVTTL